MKINAKNFRVRPGKGKLADWPTIVKPFFESKNEYQELLKKHVEELSSAAAASLRLQPLCVAADFSRDGFGGKGRRDSPRHVRSRSGGLRGFQLQAAERGRTGA